MRKKKIILFVLLVIIATVKFTQLSSNHLVFLSKNVEGLAMAENPSEGGTCCPEKGSICVFKEYVFADYYFILEGPCNPIIAR